MRPIEMRLRQLQIQNLFPVLAPVLVVALTACGSESIRDSSSSSGSSPMEDQASNAAPARFNQVGFYPGAQKIAVVADAQSDQFSLADEFGNKVFQANLSDEKHWLASGEQVRLADFSAFDAEGSYRLTIAGHSESNPVIIDQNAFAELSQSALKYYYFSRSGFELKQEYAGQWQRQAGHPDTQVFIHASAASPERPEGTIVSAPQGWYDAGDFNKYIVNSGITTYTLLSSYEAYPEYFASEEAGFIPESDNGIPDILDEALWNIHWMLAMQDPNDGGVYHKLTTKNFQATIMPEEAVADRYLVQKSTSAALNLAAVMAVANRVFDLQAHRLQAEGKSDLGLATLADNALSAAEYAWQWAEQFPDVAYQQPADISTGEYGDSQFQDEFAWAAAELFISTGEAQYYRAFVENHQGVDVPSFAFVDSLGALSLLRHRDSLAAIATEQFIQELADNLRTLAEDLTARQEQSAYGITYGEVLGDFVWGGNAVALNQSLILLAAHNQFAERKYLSAALANIDYVLGRNPLALSYVTGFGEQSPMYPHHRVSAADGIQQPVPGMLAGGAQPGQQDACAYLSGLHALSYIDDYCSYSTNEIAINWNAPLVFVTAALDATLGNP